jgi:hypothetical protein
VTQEGQAQPFDEQAVLAELERLRESIQAARKARQRTSDEFDAFVKSFRTPASTPTSERPIPASRAPAAAPQEAPESIDRSMHAFDPLPSPVHVPSNTELFGERPELPPAKSPRQYRFDIRLLGVLALIAVIALGLLSIRWRGPVSPPKTVKTVSDNTTLRRDERGSTPAATAPAPANAGAHGVALELRAIRPVWMRVVVDGRKDAEGTIQAGEPLHFTGDDSIVVRVGNGGDVVVRIGDREESFGEAGQPRTRTFSKPSAPGR